MGLIGKLIAGKLAAKAVQRLKQKNAAAETTLRARQGQYIVFTVARQCDAGGNRRNVR